MSMSELHDWECAIERLGGENAGELLKIAQDIYNTAFVRGRNYEFYPSEKYCPDCGAKMVESEETE